MAVKKEPKADEYVRIDGDDAVVEDLDVDDHWNDLVTENAVPPLKIKGIVLKQPTKRQVETWRANPANEVVLFGQETYDKLQELFADLPQKAWENFNNLYLEHMFGFKVDQGDSLKG